MGGRGSGSWVHTTYSRMLASKSFQWPLSNLPDVTRVQAGGYTEVAVTHAAWSDFLLRLPFTGPITSSSITAATLTLTDYDHSLVLHKPPLLQTHTHVEQTPSNGASSINPSTVIIQIHVVNCLHGLPPCSQSYYGCLPYSRPYTVSTLKCRFPHHVNHNHYL